MILEEKDLSSIISVAVRTWEENGEIHFSRFTEQQTELYAQKNGGELLKKTFATASMTLDFITDADKLSFDWFMREASSRRFYHFDFFVDGVMTDHFDAEKKTACARGHAEFSIPEGKHHITLYLPNLMMTTLYNVELHGATMLEPVKKARKFYFVGDSITQGYDAIYPSMSYVNRVARVMNAEVLNQAIGSEIFDEHILDADLPYAPELVVIAYGTNDFIKCESHEQFIGNAEAFFLRAREVFPEAQIAYISPIWRGETEKDNSPVGEFFTLAKELGALAEACGLFHIDGQKLVPHLSSFYSDLTLHPNDMGFSFYAENFVRAICEF